jgi:hypothetical protein
MKKNYPFIFILAFWGILIIPILKADITVTSLEKNFLGHEKLIEGYNTLRFMLGDRVFPTIIVGKDGWLFYTAEKSIDDYQGTNPYTPKDLRDISNKFEALNDQLKQKGIMLIVVIAPNKSTIYPEYMPDQIKKIRDASRLKQFVDYMHKNGKTILVDLRADLIEVSKTRQVFYKTNTHWNPYGEYTAYAKIMFAISQRYPKLISHPLSDYEEMHAGLITHDIPRILGMPNIKEEFWVLKAKFASGTNFREVPLSDGRVVRLSWNQDQNLPSALIYHDSFLDGVVPFLEPHFRQTTSIPSTSIPGIWSSEWLEQAHPDIVIIEYAERFMNFNLFIPGNQ